jgi:hypothetical protein
MGVGELDDDHARRRSQVCFEGIHVAAAHLINTVETFSNG